MISEEEREAWREVEAACARLTACCHRISAVWALRVDVERAVENLKRVIGAVTYTPNELQASVRR